MIPGSIAFILWRRRGGGNCDSVGWGEARAKASGICRAITRQRTAGQEPDGNDNVKSRKSFAGRVTSHANSPLTMKTLASLLALALLTMSTLAADGPIRHVVHFKFKPEATPEQIKKITE